MTSKNVCSICRYNRVAVGHLCPDCLSPKLVQFDADKNKRYANLPIFSENLNNEYTHADIDELLPIPELVEEPLEQHAEDPDEKSQSETGALIADIENTLRMLGSDDDELKITPSKIKKSKKIKGSSTKSLHPRYHGRVSKMVKKKRRTTTRPNPAKRPKRRS